MPTPTISLNVVTYCEAERIGACLDHVAPFVVEMIVVDQCSTDGTADIATAHGAKVIKDSWHGYGDPSRPLAEAASTGDWILILDADEVLLGPRALRGLCSRSDADGWNLPRANFFGGQFWSIDDDSLLRVFRRGSVVWPQATMPHRQPRMAVGEPCSAEFPGIIHDKSWAEQLLDDQGYENLGAGTGRFLALSRELGVTGEELDAMTVDEAIAIGFDCSAVLASM